MPNEKREEQADEKRQSDAVAAQVTGDQDGERQVAGSEAGGEEHEGRERQGRERREMEAADPRVGRGGAPVGAGTHEDEEDAGDGAVAGRP